MRTRTFCALTVGSLAAAVACSTQAGAGDSTSSVLVPRTTPHLTVASSAETMEPSIVPAGSTIVLVAAEDEVDDGWRPARPAERVGHSTDGPSASGVVPASQKSSVPPAPPAPASEPETLVDAVPVPPGTPLSPPAPAGKPIDLGTALALVAGQNPSVNFARARVREAYARVDRAEIMWIPDLQAGAAYHRHEGNYQDSAGQIVDIGRSSVNAGLGAGATGAGTVPVPGLVMDFHLTDAIFGPEIARRSAWAAQHAVDAELNDQLLNVAVAHLNLIEAEQRTVILRQTLETTNELVDITTDFARAGQGLRADAERAGTERALRRNELLRAEEEATVASARLATLVRLNPAERLTPAELIPVRLELVDPTCEPRSLVADALGRRPELRQQKALVAEAVERLQREKYAPLVPSVLIGASYSGFGGGLGDRVGNFNDRADFDAMAVWEVRNLGFGERAARNEASARIEQARFRELRIMDEVAREVVEAHAQVAARAPQIEIANEAVAAAERSYRLNRQRIRDAQGLPIEAIQSIQALDAARREYLRAVTDYNEAQFRLHRALGWPIQP